MASKQVTYAELDEDEFEYSMRNRSRGFVYIINNYEFDKLPPRNSSDADRAALTEALLFVGFESEDINYEENLKAQEMVEIMEKAGRQDYSKKGCLFIAILSHGDEQLVSGTDKPLRYDDLLQPLRVASAFRLKGIPKILLVQACKAELGDYSPDFNNLQPSSGPVPSRLQSDAATAGAAGGDARLGHDAAIAGMSRTYSTAAESDFLIAYSVTPGTHAGSRFIQAFSEVMQRDGRRLQLTHMLTAVNRLMSYTPGTSVPDKNQASPCIMSQLRKDFYFS